jgi:hypothetical protein
VKLNIVNEMLIANVNAENLIRPGVLCEQMAKNYAIGFNPVAKKGLECQGSSRSVNVHSSTVHGLL